MATKKPAKAESPGNPGLDREVEIERLKDEVPLPAPRLAAEDGRLERAFVRLHRRVMKWAESKTKEQVAGELVEALFEKRIWDQEQVQLCEALARDRAERKFQRINARKGRGYGFWDDVRTEWLAWQASPEKFDGLKGFAAAMEVKFPGLNARTLPNKITAWKAESRNGDS